MAVTYTWTIPTVERNLSDGGITTIHWRCTGVDGDQLSVKLRHNRPHTRC